MVGSSWELDTGIHRLLSPVGVRKCVVVPHSQDSVSEQDDIVYLIDRV